MAKVRLDPRNNIQERALTRVGKRPSLAGVVSIRPDSFGRPSAALFPVQRRVRTQKQILASLWFRYMTYIYKVTDSFFVENYRSQSIGLWLQPRDIFLAAHAGRLFGFIDEKGKKYFSYAARKDMSESLDTLAQRPGSLLFRGPEYWDGLEPGLPGQVLLVGFSGLPTWANISDLVSSEARTAGLSMQFYHPNQGAGWGTLPNGVRAVRFSGTATSRFVWSVYSPVSAHDALARLYFQRDGSDGGDYFHNLKVYVVRSSGELALHSDEDRADPAPPPGGDAVYAFNLWSFPYDPDRIALLFQYERRGAQSADTNNSYSYLWFWEVRRW